MKRKGIWVGSVGAGVLLVLTILMPVVNAQTTITIKKDVELKINKKNSIVEKFFHDTLIPGGGLLDVLFFLWNTFLSWFLWFYWYVFP